jgi:hypothetical protein
MTKPRNKAYRPRQVKVPMTASSARTLVMQWYVHLDGFLNAPTADSYNCVMSMVATVEGAMAAQRVGRFDLYFRSVKSALDSIVNRHIPGRPVVVRDEERATLDAGAPFIEAAIKACRWDTFVVARNAVSAEVARLGESIVFS